MSRRWVSERKRDYFYRKAKTENYRSRAAYKLMQLDEKFRIFRPGDAVIDLGANPGGWSQVALEKVGKGGTVIAIDLKPVEPIQGLLIFRGDARSESVMSQVRKALPGGFAHVVISDMAPNISGNYSLDHARSIELAEFALAYADRFLAEGGNMLVKVFDGDMSKSYFKEVSRRFKIAKRSSPEASRKTSSEIYVVGKGKKGAELPYK